jgi:hypothetical protein
MENINVFYNELEIMLYMLSHVSFCHLIQMQDDQKLNLVHNEWCVLQL